MQGTGCADSFLLSYGSQAAKNDGPVSLYEVEALENNWSDGFSFDGRDVIVVDVRTACATEAVVPGLGVAPVGVEQISKPNAKNTKVSDVANPAR